MQHSTRLPLSPEPGTGQHHNTEPAGLTQLPGASHLPDELMTWAQWLVPTIALLVAYYIAETATYQEQRTAVLAVRFCLSCRPPPPQVRPGYYSSAPDAERRGF